MQAKFPVGKRKLFLGLVGVSPKLGICVSRLVSHLALLMFCESRAGSQHLPPFPQDTWGWSTPDLSIPLLTLVEIGWWL